MKITIRPLILFSIFFLVSSCSANEKENYFTLFSKKSSLQELPLNLKFSKEKVKLSSLEKDYLNDEFGKITEKKYHTSWTEQDQYIYFHSLMLQKKWNFVLSQLPRNPYLNSEFLGPYFNLMLVQANLAVNKVDTAYTIYTKSANLFSTLPNTNLLHSILNTIAAKKRNPKLADSPGGYNYYMYFETRNVAFFKKAVLQKDPLAIGSLNKRDYKRFIPTAHYHDYLDVLKQYNFGVYLQMLQTLHMQGEVAQHYFDKERYASALSFAGRDSFIAHMSRLMLNKPNPTDIPYAKKNIEKSVFYLATYYYNHDNYNGLAEILKKGYHFGTIRYLILTGFEKSNYATMLSDLLQIKANFEKDFTTYDKELSSYWAGFLYNKVGQSAKANGVWIQNASYYPCSFYGWESYKSVDKAQITKVVANWKDEQEKAAPLVNAYINKMNSAVLPNNVQMKRALFFMSIREDKLGFIYIHNLFESSHLERAYYAIPLARLFYSINRMDYYNAYIKVFYKKIIEVSRRNLFYSNLLPHLFPLQYKSQIEKASKQFGFDPAILQSLILKESAYDSEAISWVGARGLSQLMPATARPIIATLYKKGIIKNKDIFDPQTNVMLGGYYLHWLYYGYYKNFSQDYRLVLSYASYNAGPGRIKRMYNSLVPNENVVHFIESISLTESRDYVKELTLYNDMYRFIY